MRDPAALPPSLFDLERVGSLLDAHLDGRVRSRDVLFALFSFGRWHEKYVGGWDGAANRSPPGGVRQ